MSFGLRDPRLPIGPLWRVARVRCRQRNDEYRRVDFSCADLADACGVSKRSVLRWREAGLTWDAADQAAVAIGLHPASVWGDAFWAGVEREDVG